MIFQRIINSFQKNFRQQRQGQSLRRNAPSIRSFEALEDRRLLSFDPSGFEQEMLEHINRMRMNPADELGVIFISTEEGDANYFVSEDADVNTAINFFEVDDATLFDQWAGLTPTTPLAWNEAPYDAATGHSNRMILQDMQGHILPPDTTLGLTEEAGLLDRAVNAGFNWSGNVTVAENVFAYTESVFHGHAAFAIDWGATATGIQDPAGHRNNIMDSSFQEIGISVIPENDNSTSVGPLVVTQDFAVRGNYGNARVLGVAFDDGDGDGFYNAGEGLAGLTITVSNGVDTYTTTTMSAGGYQVEVDPGTYTVTATGGSLTGAAWMGSITVGSDNVKLDLDTALQPSTGSIAGYAFTDQNQSGTFDGNERGLGGMTVFIDADGDGNLDNGEQSTITGGDGSYAIVGLSPGAHSVAIAEEPFYRDTTIASQSLTVTAGGLTTAGPFGKYEFVTLSGSSANVYGTNTNDTFAWDASNSGVFSVNGDQTSLTGVTSLTFHGLAGSDDLTLSGNGGDDDATFQTTSVTLTGTGYNVSGNSFESISVAASAGGDQRVYFYDSVGKDTFVRTSSSSTLTGNGFSNTATGFDRSYAYSTQGGLDVATLHDESSDDTYTARRDYAVLRETASTAFLVRAEGFHKVTAHSTAGGTDYAYFYDSTSDDRFTGRPTSAVMWTEDSEYFRWGHDFERNYAYSTQGGSDFAYLHDDTTDDYFSYNGNSGIGVLRGNDYEFFNRVEDFVRVYGYSTAGGTDNAYLYDGPNDDTFYGKPNQGILFQNDFGFYARATTFTKVDAYATTGGTDYAHLSDALTDDLFFGYSTHALLRGSNYEFFNRATGFERAFGSASSGNDYAYLFDDVTNDYLVSRPDYSILRGLNFEFFNRADGFDRVYAHSNAGGLDDARFVDSEDDDEFYGRDDVARITSNFYFTRAEGFHSVTAVSENGGTDTTDVSSLNYSFTAIGNWDPATP